jgi:hypothetical protein
MLAGGPHTHPPSQRCSGSWAKRALFGISFMYTVRADEAEHRDVANHLVCGMKEGQGQSFVRSRIQVGCNALEVCPQHYGEEPRQGLASIPEG